MDVEDGGSRGDVEAFLRFLDGSEYELVLVRKTAGILQGFLIPKMGLVKLCFFGSNNGNEADEFRSLVEGMTLDEVYRKLAELASGKAVFIEYSGGSRDRLRNAEFPDFTKGL